LAGASTTATEVKTREVLTTAPAAEPVLASAAQAHLRLEGVTLSATEDTLLDSYIEAARQAAENYTDSVFIDQTWALWLDTMPAIILLPKLPLSSLTSVQYYDTADDIQTFNSANYKVETLGDYNSQIHVNDNFPSLSTKREFNVKVNYVAGYGTAGTAVPDAINNAIKIMVSNLWEGLPLMDEGVKHLLNPYRVFK
jgi:uncharacterized phiE125 gp8 family phage protein